MSMSTRESMRHELKELAKLAQTMGKPTAGPEVAAGGAPIDFPADVLERPVTPASASRVSVPPIATPTPVFDYEEPKKGGKRTGLIAVLVGASLAVALVGGAAVGKSLAGNSTAPTPPVDVRGAAGVLAAPPAIAAVAPPVAVVQPPAEPAAVAAAVSPPAKSATAAPVAAPPAVRKRVPRPVAVAATPKASPAANTPATPAGNESVAAPKAAAPPAFAKPAAAKAGAGGGDSLEDLIRKEVAAQKK